MNLNMQAEDTNEGTTYTRSNAICVRTQPGRGRGVFASKRIPANTVIEESPVLVIPASQYNGNTLNTTIFESYLFTWSRSGDMAMALGLGSLLNHDDEAPNVGYTLDKQRDTIRYSTKRDILPGEELCIYYGHGVHFGKQGELLFKKDIELQETEEQALISLGNMEPTRSKEEEDPIVPLKDAPLQLVTNILSPEDMPLELIQVYIATIFPQESPALLSLLKTAGIDTMPNLRHCKRIRRPSPESTHVQVLVSLVDNSELSDLQDLLWNSSLTPVDEDKIPIGIVSVPANPARTQGQQKEWSKEYWPVTLIPVKADVLAKEREEYYTRSKLRWMQAQLSEVVKYANNAAKQKGELGIACRVTETWDGERHSLQSLPVLLAQAHDTRTSSANPLEHSVMNLISHVANLDKTNTRPSALKDSNYLLTGLTVFMTHEPCLLCSMALLHSRIHTLVYVRDSPGAGGAGTEYSLHEEKTTNHRYEVWKVRPEGDWKWMRQRIKEEHVDP